MSYTWNVKTKVLFGAGKLKELHKEALPGKKALVVISNGKSTRLNSRASNTPYSTRSRRIRLSQPCRQASNSDASMAPTS